MASIHRDPNGRSPFWYGAFRGADGTRKFKSTKLTDRKKALQLTVEWEKTAQLGLSGILTAAQARKVLSEMVAVATGETLTIFTVRTWLNEWITNKAASASANTLLRYRQVIRDFLSSMGQRADSPLAGVTPGDIAQFRDSLLAGGRAVSTCNTVVKKILSVPFEAARKMGYIPSNPVALVDSLKAQGEERKAGREPFTQEEVRSLLAAADAPWKGAILLAATTGLRLGDVARLEWAAVNRSAGEIRADTQKTGLSLVLPIHPDFDQWLATRCPGIGKAAVFPELAQRSIGGASGLSAQFRGIMERAGISQRVIKRQGAGRTGNSKGFHSLRHTFISLLANSGVPPEIRQKLAGHADARVHAGYTHHEFEVLRSAVAKLPPLSQ